jgi:hypothetical protein
MPKYTFSLAGPPNALFASCGKVFHIPSGMSVSIHLVTWRFTDPGAAPTNAPAIVSFSSFCPTVVQGIAHS